VTDTALADLTPFAGLSVWLDESTGELRFGPGVTSDPPGVRLRGDLRGVLRRRDAQGPELAYHLYRAVRRIEDEPMLARAGLRYDLTVTLPGRYGDEYVKTAGHYHPPADSGDSFPEIYEVVHGRAAFVLQHVDDVTAERPRVAGVWVQLCEPGERILIPPDCGHVTVNVGTTPLVVADLVSLQCGHLYGSFKALRGAATYVLADEASPDGLRLEANGAYAEAPAPRLGNGSRYEPFLMGAEPLYTRFLVTPDDFAFLHHPAAVVDELLALWRSSP
jgi:glucose-6-phosphate isomerase, archaeal